MTINISVFLFRILFHYHAYYHNINVKTAKMLQACVSYYIVENDAIFIATVHAVKQFGKTSYFRF